ncbi:MAG: hypothetical protein JWQ23_4305 [Herminiimonas sp.]|nr:hypothetical protein [Herminiimonas sp.]
MKNKVVISAVMAMALMAGTSAFAQGYDRNNDRHNDRSRNEQVQRGGPGDDRGHGYRAERRADHLRANDDRRDGYRAERRGDHQRAYDDRRDSYRAERRDDHQRAYDDRRDNGPRHNWRRGQRISQEYRHRQYVVNDWRSHRLSAPPRGHHWVQTGSDYVLVTIASGVIAQIVLH